MSKSIPKESEEVSLQQGFNYEETVARVEEIVAEIESRKSFIALTYKLAL